MNRRSPVLVARLVAFGATVALALALVVRPASAETSITVETPAGTLYQPGRPVPLVVTVSADQLVQGEVVARVTDGPPSAVRQQVEVPGGSTKRVVLVLDVPPWSMGPTVTFSEDGRVVARGGSLRPVRDEEPVGVFPSLSARDLPESVPLSVDVGRAMLFAFDPTLLAEGPAVLNPFTHLALTASDLDALEADAVDLIWGWVEQGGRLLVDESVPPPGLPPSLELVDGRATLGSGDVVLTGGAMGDGRYEGVFRPAPMSTMHDLPFGSMWAPTLPQLAADAGIRTPRLTGLLVLIGGYILLVGPLLWLVLRRRGRELALWVAVPAVATLATAIVWVAGVRLRSEANAGHATLVVASGRTTTGVTDLLVASPNGGQVAVALPEGWRPSALRSEEFGGGMGLPEPVLEGDEMRVRVDAGSFGVFRATGPLAEPPPWEITAEADGSGVVGRVTNTTSHDLQDVVVFAGATFDEVGSVAAGASAEYRLGDGASSFPMEPSLTQTMLGDGGMGSGPSPAAAGGAFSRWLTERGQSAFTPGTVTAVGWTRDLPAPLGTASNGGVSTGRTGFVARQAIGAPGSATPAAAVRSEVVRGPSSTPSLGTGRHGFMDLALTVSHTLPAGAAPEGLVLDVTDRIGAVEIWSEGGWRRVALPDSGRAVVALPAEAVIGGVVYARLGLGGDFWGRPEFPHTLIRSAGPDEDVLPWVEDDRVEEDADV